MSRLTMIAAAFVLAACAVDGPDDGPCVHQHPVTRMRPQPMGKVMVMVPYTDHECDTWVRGQDDGSLVVKDEAGYHIIPKPFAASPPSPNVPGAPPAGEAKR